MYGKWANEITVNIGQGTATIGTTPSTTVPPTAKPADTLVFDLEGTGINYEITGGSIKSIYPELESNSLIIEIDATDDGMLTISLPRAVIDSDIEGQFNGEFYILLDDKDKEYDETETTDTYRTLSIEFFAVSVCFHLDLIQDV